MIIAIGKNFVNVGGTDTKITVDKKRISVHTIKEELSGGGSRSRINRERSSYVMIEQIKPADIEKRSFAIITELLGDRRLDPENEPVIKRVIHTSADFEAVSCERGLEI